MKNIKITQKLHINKQLKETTMALLCSILSKKKKKKRKPHPNFIIYPNIFKVNIYRIIL